MKISFDNFKRKPPPKGWCVWDIDWCTGEVSICPWWAYPSLKLYCLLRFLRFGLYHWLNRVGIMKTPIGNRMMLSDIWNHRR